jgi:hypothetical protein
LFVVQDLIGICSKVCLIFRIHDFGQVLPGLPATRRMFYDFRGFFLKKNFILNLGLQQNKKKKKKKKTMVGVFGKLIPFFMK